MKEAILAMGCACLAWGADIDGKWTRAQSTSGQTRIDVLVLKADGSVLTGTIDLGREGPVAITEGKIDGAAASFKVFRQPGDTGTLYSGTVSASELLLTPQSLYVVNGGKDTPGAPPPPPPPGGGKRRPQEQVWTRAK